MIVPNFKEKFGDLRQRMPYKPSRPIEALLSDSAQPLYQKIKEFQVYGNGDIWAVPLYNGKIYVILNVDYQDFRRGLQLFEQHRVAEDHALDLTETRPDGKMAGYKTVEMVGAMINREGYKDIPPELAQRLLAHIAVEEAELPYRPREDSLRQILQETFATFRPK